MTAQDWNESLNAMVADILAARDPSALDGQWDGLDYIYQGQAYRSQYMYATLSDRAGALDEARQILRDLIAELSGGGKVVVPLTAPHLEYRDDGSPPRFWRWYAAFVPAAKVQS